MIDIITKWCILFPVASSGVEERYLGRLKRAHNLEIDYG
jgi:hypothetical protein